MRSIEEFPKFSLSQNNVQDATTEIIWGHPAVGNHLTQHIAAITQKTFHPSQLNIVSSLTQLPILNMYIYLRFHFDLWLPFSRCLAIYLVHLNIFAQSSFQIIDSA